MRDVQYIHVYYPHKRVAGTEHLTNYNTIFELETQLDDYK